MKKFLLILFLFSSCITLTPPSKNISTDETPPLDIIISDANEIDFKKIKTESNEKINLLKIETKELRGFSLSQEARFINLINASFYILNSDEFKKLVLRHTFKNKLGFHDTTDTNEEVYNKITSKDWILEYRLENMRLGSSAIGYTYPSVSWIVINARKFNSLKDEDIVANIFHEYGGHKLGGYNHSFNHNKDRPFSVPYALGSIAKEVYLFNFSKDQK